ncbi:secologanin synthase 2-like [Rhododendron vialii]|uniref:secologanin synthase 2-like n=1 Tax=Rhododendron vialii TaxID=182163 RepID=UPI00265ECFA8|nr:secologanin synthase 2-like [Rhododendron vialii]
MEMDTMVAWSGLAVLLVIDWRLACLAVLTILAWRFYYWAWVTPKRIEKLLREQGFDGNPYKFLVGDIKEYSQLLKEAHSKPIDIDDNTLPRVYPIVHKSIQKYGKKNFVWFGRIPKVTILDPQHVKEVLTNYKTFQKHFAATNPLCMLFLTGIGTLEGDKYLKHKKIIAPALHLEKLKGMVSDFDAVYSDLIVRLKKMTESTGSVELDVAPLFETVTIDVISRTAFGSSYTEGQNIFALIKEMRNLTFVLQRRPNIPYSHYLPTRTNIRIRQVNKELDDYLRDMIERRMNEMKGGAATKSDLLGLLLESNFQAIKLGNESAGMSMKDIIDECKLFYFAGHETIGLLLVWTTVMLSRHPKWQESAREEVFQVLGKERARTYDDLSRLKIVTAILYEALRLFPPVPDLSKITVEETKLGDLTIPAGVVVMLQTIALHRDKTIYGPDAMEFNPERFFEGVVAATKGQLAFIAFSSSTRACLGQVFALTQVKLGLAMILQHFSFELSPSYKHGPKVDLVLTPQYGAPIIYHRLKK